MPTSIEWTDETWNPVRGCSRISPGCKNCYAERDAARKNYNLKLPGYKGFAEFRIVGQRKEPHWTGKVELIPDMLDRPLHWRAPRRVFVNSMSDLWHEKLAPWSIAKVYAVMCFAHRHTFQVLTKRSGMRLDAMWRDEFRDMVFSEYAAICINFGLRDAESGFK
ncbi:MAG: DUF5131 family protein, partial [Patescibacteria group bacterium]|nr:DUF5131 family protein [Patescibacteria group bacterium]